MKEGGREGGREGRWNTCRTEREAGLIVTHFFFIAFGSLGNIARIHDITIAWCGCESPKINDKGQGRE